MKHWLTDDLAAHLLEGARTVSPATRRHVPFGGDVESGPLKGLKLLCMKCNCCDNVVLYIDGKKEPAEIDSVADLRKAIVAAERERRTQ